MSLDRSKAPSFNIPEEIDFSSPIQRTLSNGVPLYFIPTPELNAIKIEINTDALRGDLGQRKKLVSYFTLHMLLEGTKTKDASTLDDFFDYYASEVEIISNFEHNGLSLLTTKKHLYKVLPVFRELMTEAVFPDKELAKRKSQKALSISIQREQNSNRASQLFRKQLFGDQHPFGQIADEEDVEQVTSEDLKSFYSNKLWINPEIFLTGNLNGKEIDFIAQELGNLPVITGNPILEEFINQEKERVWEKREKSVQSSIRLGCHLIPKNHPDYHALSVFNTFLGGYFGSRLIKNIREEKGHTYGIYSSIGSLRSADYWIVAADVIKEHAEEVISEIYKEIKKLQEEPIPAEELEVVRNYMIGSLLSNFSSSFELINRFKSIHHAGLDLDFYKERLAFIRSFDEAHIRTVGAKYIQAGNLVEVIVG